MGKYPGQQGYLPPQNQPTELIAQIGYEIRPAEGSQYGGSGSSVGVGVGGGGHGSNVEVGISIPIAQGEPDPDYIRTFILKIIRRSDGVILYEGQVTSREKEALPPVLPCLVDALFQDFPGKNGTSNRVKVTP